MVDKPKVEKIVDAKSFVEKISSLDSKITSKLDKLNRYHVRHDGKLLCFVLDSKYGAGVRRNDGGKFKTFRMKTEEDVTKEISVLQGQIKTP